MGEGLKFVYLGNVPGHTGENTYCPDCGTLLIGRDGYRLGAWKLSVKAGEAACGNCGEPIAGVFDAGPGHWGAQRRPLIGISSGVSTARP